MPAKQLSTPQLSVPHYYHASSLTSLQKHPPISDFSYSLSLSHTLKKKKKKKKISTKMEISIEEEEIDDPKYMNEYRAFTVHVDTTRILTIETDCGQTPVKWLKDAVKSTHNSKFPYMLVVGLVADRFTREYTKGGLRDSPYELLQLCIGSNCLLYHLRDIRDPCGPRPPSSCPKFLRDFFMSHRVAVVGMDMKRVKEKLARDFGIEIRHAYDLNDMAVKALERDELDLGKYDLDKLAKLVLGKGVDVARPEKRLEWYDPETWGYYLYPEKVKYATVDAYLSYMVGAELLWEYKGPWYYPEVADKKRKEKEKKGTIKNLNKRFSNMKVKKN